MICHSSDKRQLYFIESRFILPLFPEGFGSKQARTAGLVPLVHHSHIWQKKHSSPLPVHARARENDTHSLTRTHTQTHATHMHRGGAEGHTVLSWASSFQMGHFVAYMWGKQRQQDYYVKQMHRYSYMLHPHVIPEPGGQSVFSIQTAEPGCATYMQLTVNITALLTAPVHYGKLKKQH